MNEINEKARELFIHYGSAASEVMFDYPCHFFQIPDCVGVILYRIEFNCAIVFGDPICPFKEIPKITEAFHQFCDKMNFNIIYLIVSEKFVEWAKKECKILMEVCEELIFNPQEKSYLTSKRLQHRLNKAVKYGLTIHEYIPSDAKIEEELKQVAIKWQQSIKGPNLYIGHFNFFETYVGKRWFYIKDKEQITAMAMLSKIDAYEGWLLKFFMTSSDAVHDTSEFLMVSILETLKKENCHFLTKGMMPVDDLHHIMGLNRFSIWILKFIYKGISQIFRFKKRKEYWFRYHPQVTPAYLLFYRAYIGLNEIRALVKVFKANYSGHK